MTNTPSAPRCIALRRPVTLHHVEGPFVPDRPLLDEVDRRWAVLCGQNDAYFDGRCLHVVGVHRNGCGGASIHVMDCAYRFHAVQDEQFDVGMRGLGVKGMTWRDGQVLMGLRSTAVSFYGGLWEFAPGGAVEPDRTPLEVITAELKEETSLTATGPATAIALLYDPVVRTWEVVFKIANVTGEPCLNPEYQELQWCSPTDLPDDLSPMAEQMRQLL